MAEIYSFDPKNAQIKGTGGPILVNNPIIFIGKLRQIQWNHSFLNLKRLKNRVCKGPPFGFGDIG